MIDLTNEKNPAERLNAICRNRNRESGQWIVYAQGDYSSDIGRTPVGRAARELFDSGIVHMFQKRISDEPRTYVYVVVVK